MIVDASLSEALNLKVAKGVTMATNEKLENDPKANPQGNAIKDPEEWVTKDEPMTGAQASYLKTLSEEAGAEFNADLTKAEASERIDELQRQTGRGQNQ